MMHLPKWMEDHPSRPNWKVAKEWLIWTGNVSRGTCESFHLDYQWFTFFSHSFLNSCVVGVFQLRWILTLASKKMKKCLEPSKLETKGTFDQPQCILLNFDVLFLHNIVNYFKTLFLCHPFKTFDGGFWSFVGIKRLTLTKNVWAKNSKAKILKRKLNPPHVHPFFHFKTF